MTLTDTIARASQHQFIGRLGSDPELKSFQSGVCVARARLAINYPDAKREDRDATDWFTVECWNQEAETFVNDAHKGDLVRIWGRVKLDRYQGRDGEERTNLVIKPSSWEVLPTPARQQDHAPRPASSRPPAAATAAAAPAWDSSADIDDEVPF